MRQNVEHLMNEGPTAATDMKGEVSWKDRQAGVWSFDVTASNTGQGRIAPVYYVRGPDGEPIAPNSDLPPKEAVLMEFFRANQTLIETKTEGAITRMLNSNGPNWADAVESVMDRVDVSDSGVAVRSDSSSASA